MSVRVRDRVLAPHGHSCPGSDSCAIGLVRALSTTSPCGTLACPVPTALLVGPTAISNCPDATIVLDGSASNPAGIVLPTYEWSVVAANTINAAVLRVTLAPLPDKPSADDRLVLRALAVTIDDADAAVAALVAAGLATSAADALARNVQASELPWAYTWMAYSDSANRAQLDLSDPAVCSTGPGRANLLLLRGAMVAGATYLTYALSSGVAAVTAFVVSAAGLIDDDEQDMPLQLSYAYALPAAGAEERALLGELRLGSTAKFGAAALGESASLCNVASSTLDEPTLRLIMEQIDVAAAVGKSDEMHQLVRSLAFELSTVFLATGANATGAANVSSESASVLLDANATGLVTLGFAQGAHARMLEQLLEAQVVHRLASSSVLVGIDTSASFHLACSFTTVLAGNGVSIGDESRAKRDGLVSRAAHSLALGLLKETVVGEASLVASSATVSAFALRAASSDPEVESLQMPGSSAGSVQLGSAAAAAGGEGGLDVHIVIFHHDIHAAEAGLALAAGFSSAALAGNATDAEPSLSSSVASAIVSVDLALIGGDRLLVSGLAQPVLIALSFVRVVATAGPVGASGTCVEYGGCRGRGACVGGSCLCEVPWLGADCSLRVKCDYWNELTHAWATDGCTTVYSADEAVAAGVSPLAAASLGNGTVGCASMHLTDFAAVYLPTSTEDLKTEMADNPWIYGLVFGLVGLDLLGLLVAHAYDRRARLRELVKASSVEPEEATQIRECHAAAFARMSAESKRNLVSSKILRIERTLLFTHRASAASCASCVEWLAESVEHVADGVEACLDQLDAAARDARIAAAMTMQRYTRGRLQRQISSRVRAMREADATSALGLAMTTEHTLLALCSSDGLTSRRAEHVQILANTLSLQLVLGCVFDSDEPGDSSTHPLQIVLLAVITAGLCAPALAVFKLTFALAKDQPPRLLDRHFKMLSAVPARTSKRGAGGWERVQRARADGTGAQKPMPPWRMAHALSRQAAPAPAAEEGSATLRRRARGLSQPLSPMGKRWSSLLHATPDWVARLPVRRASAPMTRVSPLDVVSEGPIYRLAPLAPLTATGAPNVDDLDASRLAPSPPPSPPTGERRRWRPEPPPSEDEPPTVRVRGISWPPVRSQATPVASQSKLECKKSSLLSEPRASGASVRSEASSLSGSRASETSVNSEASLRATELDVENLRALLVELDVDSSGALDVAELAVLLDWLGKEVHPRAAAAIFRRFDRDGNGKARLDEIEQWFRKRKRAESAPAPRGAVGEQLLTWLAMFGLYTTFLVLILAYGLQFDDAKVARLIQSWGIGLSQTLALEEPIMILIAELIPAVIDAISEDEYCGAIVNEVINSFLARSVSTCLASLSSAFGELVPQRRFAERHAERILRTSASEAGRAKGA
ncbi:hypothetical protein T492DRAFT_867786 [Pavlovales sp. CCMP2436]|nr:hypothetical protein T492DRAFT_867786 [Pavlovales sp. CCMP2436]